MHSLKWPFSLATDGGLCAANSTRKAESSSIGTDFGGGSSLAGVIQSTGVAEYLGGLVPLVSEVPVVVLLGLVCLGILLLTELTSNTATAGIRCI